MKKKKKGDKRGERPRNTFNSVAHPNPSPSHHDSPHLSHLPSSLSSRKGGQDGKRTWLAPFRPPNFSPSSGGKYFSHCSYGSMDFLALSNFSPQLNKGNVSLSFIFPSLPFPSFLNHSNQIRPYGYGFIRG